MIDIRVENHGSVFLLRPVSCAADEWLRDHVSEEALWFGGALACEPRCVAAIVAGAVGDSLRVR